MELEAQDSPADLLPSAPTLEQIERLEQALISIEGAVGIELTARHHFAPGVYARELFIPAGTVLTGARHKHAHLITFSGDMTVWHEGQMVRLTGFHQMVSSAGAKRVGFAHADTWCTGYFPNPTEERDTRKLEEMLVEDSHMLQNNRRPALPYVAIQALED